MEIDQLNFDDIAQINNFAVTTDFHDEKWVFEELKPVLEKVIKQNNADSTKLRAKKGKTYTSVLYEPQLAFRIYCRDGQSYFSVANIYAEASCADMVGKKGEQFTNFSFSATSEGVARFADFLSIVMDSVINAIPKQFDCCSRYNQCSDARRCIHPDPEMAVACGYRKILKQGHIYYGKNRNI